MMTGLLMKTTMDRWTDNGNNHVVHSPDGKGLFTVTQHWVLDVIVDYKRKRRAGGNVAVVSKVDTEPPRRRVRRAAGRQCCVTSRQDSSFDCMPLQHLINEGWVPHQFLAVPRWRWEIRLLALGRTIWCHSDTNRPVIGILSILGNGVQGNTLCD